MIKLTERAVRVLCANRVLLFVLYKILLDLICFWDIADRYAYVYGGVDANLTKYLLSWIVYFAFVFGRICIKNDVLRFVYGFYLLVSACPSLTIYWVKNENSVAAAGIVLFWLVFILFSIFISNTKQALNSETREDNIRGFLPSPYNPIVVILFAFLCLSTLYFSFRYGGFRLFVNFSDVYQYRLFGERMTSIGFYIFNWNKNVALPICLIIHLKHKKIPLIVTDVFVGFATYSIYGEKMVVFQLAIIFGAWVIFVFNLRDKFIEIIALFFNVILALGIIIKETTLGKLAILLIYRLLYIPAEAHYFYYDFFKNGEKLYLRQSIFRWITDSPYNETVSVIIGTKYNYAHNYNNLNNGLFSDAFANFGFVGCIVYPIIIVSILLLLSRSLKNFDNMFKYTVLLTFLLNMLGTPLMQNLLTGGILIAMLIFAMLKEKKRYIV